jgi:pyruvate dehydrogenase (quinone)
MGNKTVGQVLVDTLVSAGVQRIYGVPGDSLNAMTDAIRKTDGIVWSHGWRCVPVVADPAISI